ncbi:MAG: RNA methyltransferase, partial [Myxococcales bacterium]|nr:RNA methyltransferase [Myxococcales bacterium]
MSVPCFATTAPGLEPFLERELRELGFEGLSRGPSGVAFEADRLGFMRACLSLRTAHRVLRTLGTADASSPEALYASVRRLVDWPAMAPPDKTLAVYATARDSVFRDARLAGLTVKDAVVDAVRDALGARPSVDTKDPDLLLRVGVKGRHAVVSLDGAGKDSLHARGYRRDAGEAPLRETLA